MKQPHVDVERVDSINLESTRPPTCRLVHHPYTQEIVEINSWPVIWQHTVGQCRQVVVGWFLNVYNKSNVQTSFIHWSINQISTYTVTAHKCACYKCTCSENHVLKPDLNCDMLTCLSHSTHLLLKNWNCLHQNANYMMCALPTSLWSVGCTPCLKKTVPTYFLLLVCQIWTDLYKNWKDCPRISP